MPWQKNKELLRHSETGLDREHDARRYAVNQLTKELLWHSETGLDRAHDARSYAVNHLTKEFEHRPHVIISDTLNFLVEVKSGKTEAILNLDEEIQKLKSTLDSWKKIKKNIQA